MSNIIRPWDNLRIILAPLGCGEFETTRGHARICITRITSHTADICIGRTAGVEQNFSAEDIDEFIVFLDELRDQLK